MSKPTPKREFLDMEIPEDHDEQRALLVHLKAQKESKDLEIEKLEKELIPLSNTIIQITKNLQGKCFHLYVFDRVIQERYYGEPIDVTVLKCEHCGKEKHNN